MQGHDASSTSVGNTALLQTQRLDIDECNKGNRLHLSPDSQIEENTVDEDHECPVCVDLLANPCMLRCEHAFCRLCLLKIAKLRVQKYLQPMCPLCREPFVLTDLFIDENMAIELTNTII